MCDIDSFRGCRSPGFPAPRPRPSASYLSLRPRMLAQGEETHQKRKRKRRETEPGPPILTNERSPPSHVTLPPTPVDVPCRSVGDVFHNNQRMTLPCLQPFMGPIVQATFQTLSHRGITGFSAHLLTGPLRLCALSTLTAHPSCPPAHTSSGPQGLCICLPPATRRNAFPFSSWPSP